MSIDSNISEWVALSPIEKKDDDQNDQNDGDDDGDGEGFFLISGDRPTGALPLHSCLCSHLHWLHHHHHQSPLTPSSSSSSFWS